MAYINTPGTPTYLVHILRQAAVDDLLLDSGGHQGGALDLDVIDACRGKNVAEHEGDHVQSTAMDDEPTSIAGWSGYTHAFNQVMYEGM
jgi:hypothetical protein